MNELPCVVIHLRLYYLFLPRFLLHNPYNPSKDCIWSEAVRRSEIPDTIFIVRLMAHKLLKSPIFIFPTARNEQITGRPGSRRVPKGHLGHLPGNRQIGAVPRSGQRRALGNTGAPIGRRVYAAQRHGGLSRSQTTVSSFP